MIKSVITSNQGMDARAIGEAIRRVLLLPDQQFFCPLINDKVLRDIVEFRLVHPGEIVLLFDTVRVEDQRFIGKGYQSAARGFVRTCVYGEFPFKILQESEKESAKHYHSVSGLTPMQRSYALLPESIAYSAAFNALTKAWDIYCYLCTKDPEDENLAGGYAPLLTTPPKPRSESNILDLPGLKVLANI